MSAENLARRRENVVDLMLSNLNSANGGAAAKSSRLLTQIEALFL
jgi:hypothetical protein